MIENEEVLQKLKCYILHLPRLSLKIYVNIHSAETNKYYQTYVAEFYQKIIMIICLITGVLWTDGNYRMRILLIVSRPISD